jgi:hypothetical protein
VITNLTPKTSNNNKNSLQAGQPVSKSSIIRQDISLAKKNNLGSLNFKKYRSGVQVDATKQ